MRLRLVAQTPLSETDKGWRLLERGELTLGRDPSCGWVLPDPARTVSKVHCRIRRDATGFTVTDESTNGMSLDRQQMAHGQTARLEAGSVIAIGAQRFAAEITGEAEPDWQDPDARYGLSDDAPSITAILSDVSPGGRTASGVLPGRGGEEDWLAALDAREKVSPGEAERASRPAIGWREPIDLAITGGSRLPEDWDTEAATATRAEHRVATSTRMRVPRPPGSELAPSEAFHSANGPSAAEALDAFLQAGGTASAGDPLVALAQAGQVDREMRRMLAAMSRTLAEFEEEAGVSAGPESADALPGRQARLLDALRILLAEVDALEPARLEMQARVETMTARTLASRFSLPGGTERTLLAIHRRLYEGEDKAGPRERFNRRLRGETAADPGSDDFVELSADRPRGGDWE